MEWLQVTQSVFWGTWNGYRLPNQFLGLHGTVTGYSVSFGDVVTMDSMICYKVCPLLLSYFICSNEFYQVTNVRNF